MSKGFGIIERFSEDIDIVIRPPDDKQVRIGKNDDKPAHIKSRQLFFDWLARQIKIAGIDDVKYNPDKLDKKARNAEIVLKYGKDSPTLQEGILLEVRFYKANPTKNNSHTHRTPPKIYKRPNPSSDKRHRGVRGSTPRRPANGCVG